MIQTTQKDGKTYATLDQLENWDRNPRAVKAEDFDRLIKQINENGIYKPLVVTEEGVVIGGNMRLRAYKKMEMAEAWVSVVKAPTEQQMVQIALSDNDSVGYWEEDHLAELVLDFPGIDLSVYKVGLGENSSLNKLLSKYAPDAPDEEDVPDVDVENEPKSKLGEIYELGPHLLMCGDSINPEHTMALMRGEKAAMAFTDPPYNVAYEGSNNHQRAAILNDDMSTEEFSTFLGKTCAELLKWTKGGVYICMSPKELGNLKDQWEKSGGHWQGTIIWVKDKFTLSGADYQHMYEPILYGWKNGEDHFFSGRRDLADVWEKQNQVKVTKENGKTVLSFKEYRVVINGDVDGEVYAGKIKKDLWYFPKPTKSEEHPTMKPVDLCIKAIWNSSTAGEIVLDLFGGSGSTLVACDATDRNCRMMEMSPQYCDVIRKRWANLKEEKPDWERMTPKVGEV